MLWEGHVDGAHRFIDLTTQQPLPRVYHRRPRLPHSPGERRASGQLFASERRRILLALRYHGRSSDSAAKGGSCVIDLVLFYVRVL